VTNLDTPPPDMARATVFYPKVPVSGFATASSLDRFDETCTH